MSVASKPLLNKTVVVACSAKKMAELISGLEALGGEVVPLELIQAREIDDKRSLDAAILSLAKYSWIVFTSAYGVAFFTKRLDELGISRNRKAAQKICAVGPATAKALRDCGFSVDLVPEHYVAEGVIQALDRYSGGLRRLAGERILLPRAFEARDALPLALAEAGALVDDVVCYKTVLKDLEAPVVRRLQGMAPELLVFTSSSTIKNLIAILGEEYGKKLLHNSRVAVLGPIAAKTAESFGKRAEIAPKENTVASLLDAIREYWQATIS